MSFLNMGFGVSGESELMLQVQEFSNWGLALVSGQTTSLLNLSSEENNTSVGCSAAYWVAAHLFSSPAPPHSDWISVWLDGSCRRYFLLEKLRVKLSVRSVSWPVCSLWFILQSITQYADFTEMLALILSDSHTQLQSSCSETVQPMHRLILEGPSQRLYVQPNSPRPSPEELWVAPMGEKGLRMYNNAGCGR